MANGSFNREPPAAPPVYRPPQTPRVLQTKSSSTQSPQAGQAPRRPVAPPVYRPEAKKIVQPKAVSPRRNSPNAPPTYRPEQTRVAQPKMATAAPAHTPPRVSKATPVQPHPAKVSSRPTVITPARQPQVIQRAKNISEILNFIDQNGGSLGKVGALSMRRILYWNDQGVFDKANNGNISVATVKKASGKEIPKQVAVHVQPLPEWMQIREEIVVKLPDFFGGGKLWFRKDSGSVVFNGRGWISDNFYWRSPNPPKVRYMIHAILEWANDVQSTSAPTPHITLRNAETQANIDLDNISPLSNQQKRITGELEVTRASYSQGLGVNRQKGANMVDDDTTFADLKSQAIQTWLTNLKTAAQDALIL